VATRRNIFVIGPMGAGKTTVGKRLADLRGMDFVDSDHEIEARCGVDIPFIFEKEGEAGFRRREKQVISELTSRSNIVLATGGGAVLDQESRQNLASRGFVIYLHASIEQQLQRTSRSENRPLLQTPNRREVLEQLFEHRDPLYREIADLTLESDGHNTRWLVKEIERHLDQPVGTL
jgi:shikimate kinase